LTSVKVGPAAPILEESDLFVVGDLYQVVPELCRALEALRGER
jgi:electron transfer flavoprotein alpha subunit